MWGITKDSKLLQNKNRLCSKTCGGHEIIKDDKTYIISGIGWQVTTQSRVLDPTPKIINTTKVKQKEICRIEDPTPKWIYEAKILYVQLMDNCAMFRQTAPPLTTRITTFTILGPDGFSAGKNAKEHLAVDWWISVSPRPLLEERRERERHIFPTLGVQLFSLSPPSFSIQLLLFHPSFSGCIPYYFHGKKAKLKRR